MSGCVDVPDHVAIPRADGVTGTASRSALRIYALDLVPLESAVPSARLHARHVVREWGRADWADDCELIVAELVTNAVAACARLPGEVVPPPVRLRLSARPDSVLIEVWDGGTGLPVPRRSQPTDEPGGWGLVLVAALTTNWGSYRTVGGGKCVWAILGG